MLKASYDTRKTIRYQPEFGMAKCEKMCLADIDSDGNKEIIVLRNNFLVDSIPAETAMSEIAIYDQDLNLKASDRWNGTAMDVIAADINGDGVPEIIVSGLMKRPIVRVYRYNENYKGNLSLLSQTLWDLPAEIFGFARSAYAADIDNDGRLEIIVLTIAEGSKGYVQIRLYDADMQMIRIARWNFSEGNIVKWGHNLTVADIDGDGNHEIAVIVNFNRNGVKRSDLRVFDCKLLLKQRCEALDNESMFATSMSAGDIDGDGAAEILITSGTFSGKWQGATSQLMVFDEKLSFKKITWKTFRHTWIWDMQITDIDGDGKNEIITFGGTSMSGRNQDEANIMGEIYIRNGNDLAVQDIFIWQSSPGADTRPSRGVAFKDKHGAQIAVATSKWASGYRGEELEIRLLNYSHATDALERQVEFINACNEKNADILGDFAVPGSVFAPLALEALALCDPEKSVNFISKLLDTQERPLFIRAVDILRRTGIIAENGLRKIGFAAKDDWLVISPFDNSGNAGFDTQYPPEISLDFESLYAGKGRIVRWGKIEENRWDRKWDIYIDFAYTHFDSFERTGIEYGWNNLRTESVAYALTYVYAPADIEAQIRIGNTDGIKVWLNDKPVYSADIARAAVSEQNIIPVSLIKGKNKVLVKVSNYRVNGWGFYLRITDPEGRQIDGFQYERPESSHQHNQMLTCSQLISLLEAEDELLRCLSAAQLASSGDKRGNESLVSLLGSKNTSIRAKAAFALTVEGDRRGLDPLVSLAPEQDPLFQFSASNALERMGDARAGLFSIDNVKENGKSLVEIKITERDHGFRLSPLFRGDETSHVDVGTDIRFHLGDNVSAKCASIRSFGIREPKYRAMGIGGVAIRKACDLMAEMGHTCSIVSTGTGLVAHRLYCQNGYVDRRLQWVYVIPPNNPEHLIFVADEKIKARGYSEADRTGVLSIRDQYCLNTIGPDNWLPRDNFDSGIRVVEREGEIIGYADVYHDPFNPSAEINLMHIDTNFYDEQKALKVLLSSIYEYSISEGKSDIVFRYPPIRYRDTLMQMGYIIDSSTIRHGWVGMFKIMSLPGLLREISDLLRLRFQKSVHAGWRGRLGIKGSRLKAAIIFDSNEDVNIEDNASENDDILITADDRIITSLVTGDGDVWELYRQNVLSTRPMFNERIRVLIESLFPITPFRQGGWW